MTRFKIKSKPSWYKPILTRTQIRVGRYKRRIHNLLIHSRLNVNKIDLRKMKKNIHSSSGRVSGKICTRHKKHPNFMKITNSLLPVNTFQFRIASFAYDPVSATKRLCVLVGNKNIITYYPSFVTATIGDQIYNYRYLLHRQRSFICSRKKQSRSVGSLVRLYKVSTGTWVYNVEKHPTEGALYIRSPGCRGKVMSKQKIGSSGFAGIKMPSGKLIFVKLSCYASIGRSNSIQLNYKNAGFFAKRGLRPTVRGVAMNPIDHPHGGGEGKKSHPASPKTPWGTQGKWKRTVSDKKLILQKKLILKLRTYGRNVK